MQVALGMAADQLAIGSKGDVALNDARAHACRRDVRLTGVFGKHQSGASMADTEVGAIKRPLLALLERRFQLALVHIVHQVEGTRSKLDARIVLRALRRCWAHQQKPECERRDYDHGSNGVRKQSSPKHDIALSTLLNNNVGGVLLVEKRSKDARCCQRC